MTTRVKPYQELRTKRTRRPRAATLVVISALILVGAIAIAWLTGAGIVATLATQLNALQNNPPMWLDAPMVADRYLVIPTVTLFVIVLGVMWLSPRPKDWSRVVVVSILGVVTVRYLLWRSLSTLNLESPLNGVCSVGVLALELLMMSGAVIQFFLILRVRDRRPEADIYAQAVVSGTYVPSVDVLIPSYDEPYFVLRRTIIGCQAMDYAQKRIYLLDDTRRPEIRQLAQELGCHYLTRPDNRHAKAGNLNSALTQTTGDLVVVFDADFVPTRNFLTRTVGFFQNPKVGLVQTPQSFYNIDPIARNLGLEDVLTPEEEVFYRQVQPIRDGAGGVICSGTSFVVRRAVLEAIGGFVTESISEDYFTGIRIAAQGYQLVYLDEKLSAGLAADNIAVHALQRLRWARGTLQAFFISSNPLTIPGLTPIQRLAHLEGLLHWFTSISRVGYLLIPLAYSFLGVLPVKATAAEGLYFFLPFYLLQLTVFSWLNYRSRSALLSDIYSLVLCFPLAITVVQVMLNPFSSGFKVTPKGTVSDRYTFNWKLALPLIVFFILTAISLWLNLSNGPVDSMASSGQDSSTPQGIGIILFWSFYNLIVLGIGLLILLDVPRPSVYEWFDLRRTVQVRLGDRDLWGSTTMLSEIGAEITLTQTSLPNLTLARSLPVTVDVMEEGLHLTGQIDRVTDPDNTPTLRVLFDPLPPDTHRTLVETLFCRPGQWTTRETPGEFHSLYLLFRVLLCPRVLVDRKVDVRAIAVAQS
ncbi:glycosyltransferase [Vacuolonema iberomarrocanum]|uniref:glycosyltransferase family 2 protein n=1 Tax=Vacuolonema iberomarrocanum TaxID=3454632 RepID=UPI001A074D8B|nr:glycosyltransferase [filamentous cyanobacterium LEGE 07170]